MTVPVEVRDREVFRPRRREPPVASDLTTGLARLPAPSPSSSPTLFAVGHETTTSTWPSPLKSPQAMSPGPLGVTAEMLIVKPVPVLRYTSTRMLQRTATSSRPSSLKSAATTQYGFAAARLYSAADPNLPPPVPSRDSNWNRE